MACTVSLDQHLGAGRDRDLERLPVGAAAQRSLPVATSFGLEMRATPECLEVAQRVVAHQHDISAAPTVAAVRAALGHIGLSTEAQAAVPAAAGLDVNTCAVLHEMILTCLRIASS